VLVLCENAQKFRRAATGRIDRLVGDELGVAVDSARLVDQLGLGVVAGRFQALHRYSGTAVFEQLHEPMPVGPGDAIHDQSLAGNEIGDLVRPFRPFDKLGWSRPMLINGLDPDGLEKSSA
jgi:hypothetical protein